jgi:hypothetical protein
MYIIYDDKSEKRPGDSFRLIWLNSGWHVVARGYLCRVVDQQEGHQHIEELQERRQPTNSRIDK